MGRRPTSDSPGGQTPRRHWLDPVARQLLQVTGQLPPTQTDTTQPASSRGGEGPSPLAQRASAAATSAAVGVLGAVRRQVDAALTRIEQGPVSTGGNAGGQDSQARAATALDALGTAAAAWEDPDDDQHRLAVERDLLALRLAQDPHQPLRSAEEVQLAASLGWRLDVNRAQASDWRRLPGCSPDLADRLLRHQVAGLQLSGLEDLQLLLEVPAALVASWAPLLSFQWYGSPPAPALERIPLNQASRRTLMEALGLSDARCRRLLQERQRAPFQDLADLQQRLQLPADLLESWIGRVSFQVSSAPGASPEPSPARPAANSRRRSGPDLPQPKAPRR